MQINDKKNTDFAKREIQKFAKKMCMCTPGRDWQAGIITSCEMLLAGKTSGGPGVGVGD